MAVDSAPLQCRFVRRMVAILGAASAPPDARMDDSLFQTLVRLEQEARQGGAPEASLHVIAQVRRMTWSFTVFAAMGLAQEA
jgi:hypothetical protein